MGIIDLLLELINDYTLRMVALGASTLGIVGGALGTFAVLRKQSLFGDAISHAALPGIAAAFLLTRNKAPLVLLLGAAITGWIGTLLVMGIIRNTRIKDDAALGTVLSVFFGFGLVLLTFIQKLPDANQAGLDKFLFGQSATIVGRDVLIMVILGGFTLMLLALFWKEFKLLSFDQEFARSQGFPTQILSILLTTLLVIAIVLGLQTVGVVLMSALVVAPAASARQWTDHLDVMVILSALFGALAGITGSLISSTTARIPTGPTVVLCLAVIVIVSILFAPNRGLLFRWFKERKNRSRLQVEAVMVDLYVLFCQHGGVPHAHPIEVLRTMSLGHGGVDRSLKEMKKRGLAEQVEKGDWCLTERGLGEAKRLIAERGEKI